MSKLMQAQQSTEANEPKAVDVSRRLLAPKGSCWYCEKPVGEIRRFCGKACADAFEEEKEFNLPPVGALPAAQASVG